MDTNLLTVLIIGSLGEGEIEKNKKTRDYTSEDFQLLDDLLEGFKGVCSTPHVITETSNLLDWMKGNHREQVFELLTNFIIQHDEYFIRSNELVLNPIFSKLGLTDTCLFQIAKTNNLVLITSDVELYSYASGQGVECINFNHIRFK